jgi:hypothetical protein
MSAQPVPDTLWLGTDNTNTLNVINVSKTGTVLRNLGPREGTGLAIDPAAGILYVSTSSTATIDKYNLSNLSSAGSITQSPNASFGEDMAFDGTSLYRCGVFENIVWKINPANGAATLFITTANGPIGIAFNGTFFYVSEFNTGAVKQYTTAGVATGLQFTPGPLSGPVGGLGWDTVTNTLWLGSLSKVYNINPTTGAILSSFDTPQVRFPDGLEYEAAAVVSTPTNTPTSTPTPAGVPTSTPTPVVGAVVPTLSPSMLGLLALTLAGAALFLMRRT